MLDFTDRAMGALMGAAVGDALGVTFEFQAGSAIPEGHFSIAGGGPFDFAPGAASDDTDLLYEVLRSYRKRNAFHASDAVGNMLDWLNTGPPDIGTQTRYALSCWEDGLTPPDDEDAQGNGGLMRAAAHALSCDDGSLAAEFAALDTRLTHPSTAAADCSAFYAATLWWMIQGKAGSDARRLSEEVTRSFEPYAFPKSSLSGHCLHSLRLALWASDSAESFEAGLDAVIRTGGDTDTNAAIAGGLLGAKFGLAGIPGEWLEALDSSNRHRLEVQASRLEIAEKG